MINNYFKCCLLLLLCVVISCSPPGEKQSTCKPQEIQNQAANDVTPQASDKPLIARFYWDASGYIYHLLPESDLRSALLELWQNFPEITRGGGNSNLNLEHYLVGTDVVPLANRTAGYPPMNPKLMLHSDLPLAAYQLTTEFLSKPEIKFVAFLTDLDVDAPRHPATPETQNYCGDVLQIQDRKVPSLFGICIAEAFRKTKYVTNDISMGIVRYADPVPGKSMRRTPQSIGRRLFVVWMSRDPKLANRIEDYLVNIGGKQAESPTELQENTTASSHSPGLTFDPQAIRIFDTRQSHSLGSLSDCIYSEESTVAKSIRQGSEYCKFQCRKWSGAYHNLECLLSKEKTDISKTPPLIHATFDTLVEVPEPKVKEKRKLAALETISGDSSSSPRFRIGVNCSAVSPDEKPGFLDLRLNFKWDSDKADERISSLLDPEQKDREELILLMSTLVNSLKPVLNKQIPGPTLDYRIHY